ncbi:MAG: hypothetical protein J6U01_01040 [Clostridia bacterium]|nr:hypothetical protein [Clostridia bacterium]
MAIYREDIVDIELENGTVHRSFMNKTIGEGDIKGNRFGFRCFRNGTPVQLNGSTVVGHFTRADGTTVQIDGGAVTGDTAYIELPEACYAVEGQFALAIKLSGGGRTGTIRMVDGTVINTTNGTVIDPGNVIPDLSDYLAVIEDAEEAAEIINGISITAELISGEDYRIIVTKS